MGELFKNIIDKKSKAYNELRFFLLFNRIRTEEDLIQYFETHPTRKNPNEFANKLLEHHSFFKAFLKYLEITAKEDKPLLLNFGRATQKRLITKAIYDEQRVIEFAKENLIENLLPYYHPKFYILEKIVANEPGVMSHFFNHFSERVKNILKYNKVFNPEDLINFVQETNLELPRVGAESRKEIYVFLEGYMNGQ
jgi:hypothetical protein